MDEKKLPDRENAALNDETLDEVSGGKTINWTHVDLDIVIGQEEPKPPISQPGGNVSEVPPEPYPIRVIG